jgi:hypothetical protein
MEEVIIIPGNQEQEQKHHHQKRGSRMRKRRAIFFVLLLGITAIFIVGEIRFSNMGLLNALFTYAGREGNNGSKKAVLAAETAAIDFPTKIQFDVPTLFNQPVTVSQDLTVNGKTTFNDDMSAQGHTLDLGTGSLTAGNVLYGITAGKGLASTGGQHPTLSLDKTGNVTSFQGKAGDVTLTAGSGIGISGTTISNSGVTSVQGQTGAVTFTAGSGVSISGTTISQTLAGSLTANGVVYSADGSTITTISPVTAGYILQSNGTGNPPTWVAPSGITAGSVLFSGIGSGTNTTAAMVVGSGATLSFSGSGTINASSLLGGTWAAPSGIGTTTPSTGAFTTLTGTTINGLTITNNGSNTLSLAGGKTFMVNNSLTLSGTDTTSFTLPSANDTLVGRSSTDSLTNKTIAAGSNTISGLTNSNLSGSAGITNANLANSSVIVTAGTGLSGGGAVSLGSSVTINNAGVLSLSSSQATVSASTGNITISLPQNIDTSASPTFKGVTLSALSTGIAHVNSLGVFSSSAVDLSSSDVINILPLAKGGTNANLTASNGGIVYSGASSLAILSGTGTAGQCLISGASSAPSWATCATGSNGTNYWQLNNNVLSPANTTYDFAIGGTSTSSATFAIAANTGNATTSGNLTFTNAGVIQSTANQNLTLGGTTTGNITLSPLNGSGTVIDTGNLNLSTGKTYQINGTTVLSNNTLGSGVTASSLTSVGTLTTGTWNATAIGTQYGGTGQNFSSVAQGNIPYFSGTGTMSTLSPGTANQVLITNGASANPSYANIASLLTAGTDISLSGTTNVTVNDTSTLASVTGRGATTSTNVTFNGNLTLGQNSGNTITPNGLFNASLIPSSTAVNLGSSSNPYGSVYANNLITTATGGSNGFWQLSSGVLSPANSTYDLAVGGSATGSAKFQVLASSGNASTSGNLTFTNAGVIQSTANQNLTVGGNTTGNITLSPLNGLGTVTDTGNFNIPSGNTFQINGTTILSNNTLGSGVTTSSLTSVGTLTSGVWNATAIGAQYGGTGLNTSASTGVPSISSGTWSVNSQLPLSLGGTNANLTANNGGIVYSNASSLAILGGTATAGQCLISGANSTPSWATCATGANGTNYWQLNSNVLSPYNSTLDLAVGGSATGSAFQVFGATGNATTSGNLTFNGSGTLIQTTKNQNITIGGNTTGNITLSPLNGGTGSTLTLNALTESNAATAINLTGTNPVIAATASNSTLQLNANGNGTLTLNSGGTGNIQFFSSSNTLSSSGNLTLAGTLSLPNSNTITGVSNFAQFSNGVSVGGGTTYTISTGTSNLNSLTLNGTLAVNQGGGAATKTSIDSNGNILPGTSAGANIGSSMLPWNNLFASNIYLPVSGGTDGYWQLANNVIAPSNTINDLALGGNATSSAKFQIFGATGNATTSGNLTFASNGTIQTTGNQTLIVGGNTTGGIQFKPGNSSSSLYLSPSGSAGIGTTSPLAFLDVRANQYTTPVASFSGATGKATLVLDQSGIGDIFAASQSGGTRFVIGNDGTLTDSKYITNGGLLYANGSGVIAQTTAGNNGQCLQSIGGGTPTWGSCGAGSGWIIQNGAIVPMNATTDLLVGGTATTSAKFGLINVNSGNPTATISGNLSLVVPSGSNPADTLNLLNGGTLNIQTSTGGDGGLATALYVANTGSVGIGTTSPNASALLDLTSTTKGVLFPRMTQTQRGNISSPATGLTIYDTSNNQVETYNGTTWVAGASSTQPAFSVNNNGVAETVTAGTWTKLTFSTKSYDTNSNYSTSTNKFTPTVAGKYLITVSIRCNDSTNGCIAGIWKNGSEYEEGIYNSNNSTQTSEVNALIDMNGTTDYLEAYAADNGGTNINGGTNVTYFSGTLINSNSANAGGWTNDGTESYLVNSNNKVGIGTSSPLGTLDVRASSYTIPVASISGATGMATLLVDNSGVGDLFTASQSGGTRFTISNAGLITTKSVGTGSLKTATGVATCASATGCNVNANDYSFSPSLTDTGSAPHCYIPQLSTSDPSNTIMAFRLHSFYCDSGSASNGTATARWRYITASDHPTIWLVVNADGTITATGWEAEDPIEQTAYPANPNPLAGTDLKPGQYFFNPVPLTVDELKILFAKFPQSDIASVMADLKSYIVDNRDWLSSFTSLDDINNITERYQPAAREWAFRYLASHYNLATTLGMMVFLKVNNGVLVSVDDPYGALQTYNAQLATQHQQEQIIPTNQQHADIAEWYQQNGTGIEAGDVVAIGTTSASVVKDTVPYDQKVLGIISTSPGQVLGTQQNDNDVQLALTGRVPVKVSSINGAIQPGDYLTSSSIPGVAQKATRGGSVIGKALESFDNTDPKQVGKILVFVSLSSYNPVSITASGDLSSATTNPYTALGIDEQVITQATQSALLTQNSTTSTATVTPSTSSQLNQNTTDIADLKVQVSSMSAQLGKLDDLSKQLADLQKQFNLTQALQGSSSAVLGLSTEDATVSGTLNVLSRTTLSDVGITGNLTMGLLNINGMDETLGTPSASINTVGGLLKLQPLGLAGIDILNGKITIDTNGNLVTTGNITAKTIHADKYEATDKGDNASVGEATIPAGQTSITVNTTAVTDTSKIFVTLKTLTDVTLVVTDQKNNTSFTVQLTHPTNQDVKFNWWTVN